MVSASSILNKLHLGSKNNDTNHQNGNNTKVGRGASDLESSLSDDLNGFLQITASNPPPPLPPPDLRNPPPLATPGPVPPFNAHFPRPFTGPIGPRPPPGALPSSMRSLQAPPPLQSGAYVAGNPPAPPGYLSLQSGPPNVPASEGGQIRSGTLYQSPALQPQYPLPMATTPPFYSAHSLTSLSLNGGQIPVGGAAEKVEPSSGAPHPTPTSSVIVYETYQKNSVNIPPHATSEYIVKDTGNCSPRYMRCTMNQIPCTNDLLKMSNMPLSLIVQPLALPHPSEEPIQVLDFGEYGPVRCSACKGYMNPFMKFIDQGARFVCNLCGFVNDTPGHYYCNLGPDGRRYDASERPELCKGTVEYVATKEFKIRDLMPAVYFFLIDVSINAIEIGATEAACHSVKQVISDLPEANRTLVGLATYDNAIQFYNLKRVRQPLMLVVPDAQDVYTPLHSDVIVNLSECHLYLEQLLDNIPTMFQQSNISDSAPGAALKAASLLMKDTGGKLLLFQSAFPSVGVGALCARESEGNLDTSIKKENHKLLQPADTFLKSVASDLAKNQVCVDIFLMTRRYVDIASISVIPKTTGGQIYYYNPFSASLHSAKLTNDLKWNINRLQGSEAVMRVRCSLGLQVEGYSGNFNQCNPIDVDLAGIDCDKAFMVTIKHDDRLKDGSECAFQCALVYTTVDGQRRIRVNTLSRTCTEALADLFLSADAETLLACFLREVADEIPASPSLQLRERTTELCFNILHSYRQVSGSFSKDLLLPERLKLLPLYILALSKSLGLQAFGWLDGKSYWRSRVSSISVALAVPLVYPRMMAIHRLLSQEADGTPSTPTIPLSTEFITEDGIFLLENGEDAVIYVGEKVDVCLFQQLFGMHFNDASNQFVLQQYENPSSRKFNDLINGIRRLRCCYLCLHFYKKGDPSEVLFQSYMVEDKNAESLSYVEFLRHIGSKINSKLSKERRVLQI